MESLKLQMVHKHKYLLKDDALIISTAFTKRSFQFGDMILGLKGEDGIVRYAVRLEITDQATNKALTELVQHTIGKTPKQSYFIICADFAEGVDFATCSNIAIKTIYKDCGRWYLSGDYLTADV